MLHIPDLLVAHMSSLRGAESVVRDAYSFLDRSHEHLFVAHLDAHYRCLRLRRFAGEPSKVDVDFKAIMSDAIEHGTKGLLLAHNHPSGDLRPSDADHNVTRRLRVLAEALGCAVIDHLIITERGCVSFRQLGFL